MMKLAFSLFLTLSANIMAENLTLFIGDSHSVTTLDEHLIKPSNSP